MRTTWLALILLALVLGGCGAAGEVEPGPTGPTTAQPDPYGTSPTDQPGSDPTAPPTQRPGSEAESAPGSTPSSPSSPSNPATPANPATPVPPGAAAACAAPSVLLEEISVGVVDFVALKNVGAAPVDLSGYKLSMYGINQTKPAEHVFAARTVAAGEVVYAYEYSSGAQPGDINTGANVPFFNGPPKAAKPNSVALYDPAGNLADFFAVGDSVGMPSSASFRPLSWPADFDATRSSFQRAATDGACPNFADTDWRVAPLTRP